LVTRGTQDRSMLEIAPNYVQINNDDWRLISTKEKIIQ
jgi:hypothetical protein